MPRTATRIFGFEVAISVVCGRNFFNFQLSTFNRWDGRRASSSAYIVVAVAAYLLGSIPDGLSLSRRAKGIDIRKVGRRASSARRMFMRVLGKPAGIFVKRLWMF